jgi:hypothetical protein
MDGSILVVLAIVWCITGGLGAWVATQKYRDVGEGFILGLLFGPLGVIVEALLPTKPAAAPAPAIDPETEAQRIASVAAIKREREEAERQREKYARILEREAAVARMEAENRQRDRKERLEARVKWYRARGVEPGVFAWFKVLPDWLQPLLLGLVVTTPVLALTVNYALTHETPAQAQVREELAAKEAADARGAERQTKANAEAVAERARADAEQKQAARRKAEADQEALDRKDVEPMLAKARKYEKDEPGMAACYYQDIVKKFPGTSIARDADIGARSCWKRAYGDLPYKD